MIRTYRIDDRPGTEYHNSILKFIISECHNYCKNVDIYYSGNGPDTLITNKTIYDKINNFNGLTIILIADNMFNDIEKFLPNRQILLLTTTDQQDIKSNITSINIGGDYLYHIKDWISVKKQKEKDLEHQYHLMSISMTPRPHRLLMSTMLLQNDIGTLDNSLLKISPYPVESYETWNEYAKNNAPTLVTKLPTDKGFKMLKDFNHHGQPDVNEYCNLGHYNNPVNFDYNLRKYYKHILIEIVNESSVNTIFPTEKYQQTVYGYALPLMNAGPGTVEYLRSVGFELFDEYLNHNYDNINEPAERMNRLIQDNYQILTDKEYAVNVWKACLPGMDKNYRFIKNKMVNQYKSQVQNQIKNYWINKRIQ